MGDLPPDFRHNSGIRTFGFPIHHFHFSHNILCLPPKILHNHCFQFLSGRFCPKRNNSYAKFRGKQSVLWVMWKWRIGPKVVVVLNKCPISLDDNMLSLCIIFLIMCLSIIYVSLLSIPVIIYPIKTVFSSNCPTIVIKQTGTTLTPTPPSSTSTSTSNLTKEEKHN